jgi:hippurate hydrolase
LHVSGSQPVGALTYKKGYSLANVDYVDVTVYGRGGHGATPHKTIDPIVLASDIVLNLQTLISREMDPSHSAVVSVGSIHGGTKHNIIPEEVKLQMTVRSHEYEVRQHLKTGIKRIIENMAMSARAPKPKVVYHEGVPSLYNDPDLVEKLIPVFEDVVGKKNVFTTEKEMYGEGFAFYGYKTGIPIFQFGLGSQPKNGKKEWPQPHSSKFAPDFKQAFKIGVETMTKAVIKLQNDL